MLFGQKLKQLRTDKGVSQVELAENIYVSRSAVAKWENGLGLPSSESLKLLAEYFEVGVDELCADQSSESVIVKKNVTISKSRKILIAVSAVSAAIIIALAVCLAVLLPQRPENYYPQLTAVVGIRGDLYDGEQHVDLWADYDRTQLTDTCLEVGKAYKLTVNPIHQTYPGNERPGYAGGAIIEFDESLIKFDYDGDIFDIQTTVGKNPRERTFSLTVKTPCKYATVEIQYNSYRDYMVLSAVGTAD